MSDDKCVNIMINQIDTNETIYIVHSGRSVLCADSRLCARVGPKVHGGPERPRRGSKKQKGVKKRLKFLDHLVGASEAPMLSINASAQESTEVRPRGVFF